MGHPATCRIPRNMRTGSRGRWHRYTDKANVLHVVSPGLNELMASTTKGLYESNSGTPRDQYESNRNCFVNLEVTHELGSTEVASSPWLGIPLSRYYPEISGF